MKLRLLAFLGCAVLLAGCGKKSSPAAPAGPATPTTPAVPSAPAPLPVGSQASATPNDFAAVTSKLDPGGDVFVYWNAAQTTAKLDQGLGLLEEQVGKLIAIDEADNGYVDEGFMAARAMAKMARAFVQDGGLAEIKGMGMSSLAVEQDFFRNRIYLLRDQERSPGMLFQVLDGPDDAVATGMKFAPASTVMAHYTRADIGAALEWAELALIKSGFPGDVLKDLFRPLGGLSPASYQKAFFNEPLTDEAKPLVGRWEIKTNIRNDNRKMEVLHRSDGSYVTYVFFSGPGQEKIELVEQGLWKVEDGKVIAATTKLNVIKGDRDMIPPPWTYLHQLKLGKVEQDTFGTEMMQAIQLNEFYGRPDAEEERYDAEGDPSADGDVPPDFREELAAPQRELFEEPVPEEVREEPRAPEDIPDVIQLTYTRLADFKSPWMAEYNKADALKPVEKNVAAVSGPSSPVDAVLAQYGGELGVYLTLDDQRTLPFKNGNTVLDLPTPGIVLTVRISKEAAKLTNLLLPLAAEMPDGLLTNSTVDGTTVYTLRPPADELPIKMKLEPSLFQVGDHFVLVSDLALVKEVLAVYKGTAHGLAGTAAFKRLSNGMELKGQQLQFVSPRAGELSAGLKKLLPTMMDQAGLPEDARSFFHPLADRLLSVEGASGHLAVLQLDAEGLLFDGRATGRGYQAAVKQSALIPVTMMASAVMGGQEAEENGPKRSFATQPRQQLRELTLGLKLYLEDKGEMPQIGAWDMFIRPEVGFGEVFTKPGAKGISYAINSNLRGWKESDIGPDTVLVFEYSSNGPPNHNGGLAEAKKEAAKNGGILVGFGDGNVRPVGAAQLDGLNWSKKKAAPAEGGE